MRALVVGAGAVGAILVHHLEKTKTNELAYLVRPGRKAKLTQVKLLNVKTEQLHVRERPTVYETGARLPPFDTVILAVRADQVDEAANVIDSLPSVKNIVSASAGHDDIARLRTRFPGRAVVQIVPLFLAFPDGDVIRWWLPPVARTLVTWDNDDAARELAENELVKPLVAGGLPTMGVKAIGNARECIYAAGLPALASFELAGWDTRTLGRNGDLRDLAARGAKEALRTVGGGKWLFAIAPTTMLQMLLRAAPLLPKRAQEMWRVHGPKIAAQTRAQLDSFIARAGAESEALSELRRRLG
jgi:hypothetical protein